MRPFKRPINQTISLTVRVDDGLIEKVDAFAMALNRSRADTVRHLIQHARLTGAADVACEVEVPQGEPVG